MESNLRPLTLGEILDRTAQLYRTNFLLFAGIFAVYAGTALVLNLAQLGITQGLKALHVAVWLQVLTGAAFVVKVLLVFVFAGAATAAISRAVAWVNLGEPATIRGAYATILPRLGRYMWLMVITFFMAWLPVIVLYGGYLSLIAFYMPKGFLAAPKGAQNPQMVVFGLVSIAFVLLLIPAFAYAIVMMLRYALSVPACVVENLKARQAIRRAIELSKGARGRIFVLLLLVFIIELVLVGVSQAFLFVLAIKNKGQLGPVALAVSEIVAFFTNSFIGPMYATGLTLFYYDQRARKEGYDIEWMMQAAGLTPPEPAGVNELEAPRPEPPAEPGNGHE